MKKKRKAFTLIELLAVIIVLAIIALIAMPIIFNVIENAKVKSLENSAYGVVDAVRLNYMENLMNSEDGTVPLNGSVTDLTLSGEHPTGGRWEIANDANAEDGRGIKIEGVTFASMDGYVCNSEELNNELTGKVICSKQEPQEDEEDGIVFEVINGYINENGIVDGPFDIKVTANGASSMKGCWAYDGECTPEIPSGYTCEETIIYDYVVNDSACLDFGLDYGLGQATTESLCEDADKSLVNMAESMGVSGQSLVDAGVISNLTIYAKINTCYNSTSDDTKTIFDIQTNTISTSPDMNLFNSGNNYICVESEGLQSKCQVYNLKLIRLMVDANSNGVAELGDEVCIEDECFNVLTNDGVNIRMLAKNRIDTSDNTTRKKRLQSSIKQGSPFSSDTIKGTNYNSYEGSIVEDLVGDYKTTLEGLGATISEATLITYDEVKAAPFNCMSHYDNNESIPCNSVYSWLYRDANGIGSSHWTRTAYSGYDDIILYISGVDGLGHVFYYSDDYSTSFEVRPVIGIPTSSLN